MFIETFYVNAILKRNNKKLLSKNHNSLAVSFDKSENASFASSIMKNIVASSALFRFSVKWICCIAFGSVSSFCCLLKSTAIDL